jgi:hypothetical protein
MGYTIYGPGDREPAPGVPGAILTPTNTHGDTYPYCMVTAGGNDLVFADTFDDLADALIPGYLTETDPVEQAMMRIRLAESAAVTMQAAILTATDPDTITDDEWAVLTAPKVGPGAPEAPLWASTVPLIVVETSYQPYTTRLRPYTVTDGIQSENLWWIRPGLTEDLLLSLHDIGYIRLMETTD